MMRNSIKLLLVAVGVVVVGCSSSDNGTTNNGASDNPIDDTNMIDLTNYEKVPLSEEQKYSLAYMWHEEKLAKEIYLELNKINPAQQLTNIANNAEVKHMQLVQNLVEWYDINITNLANYEIQYSATELNNMPVGKYAVPEIEDLYNTLYDYGRVSKQASLEVGCMVEVTDTKSR